MSSKIRFANEKAKRLMWRQAFLAAAEVAVEILQAWFSGSCVQIEYYCYY
jgi:hypothetical protein